MAQISKQCSGCAEVLPLEDFYRNKTGKLGVTSRCKGCKRALQRDYERSLSPERKQAIREYRKERYATVPQVRQRQNHANSRWARETASGRTFRQTKDARRRARKAGAVPEHFTRAELLALWEEACAYACVFCGAPFEHIEHFVPLSRGGAHALGNLWPSCAACNLAKADRDPWEFLRSLGVAV